MREKKILLRKELDKCREATSHSGGGDCVSGRIRLCLGS